MFQVITASFLAVALIADTLPFLQLISLKKLESGLSVKLPIVLAVFRNAISNLLFHLGTL